MRRRKRTGVIDLPKGVHRVISKGPSTITSLQDGERKLPASVCRLVLIRPRRSFGRSLMVPVVKARDYQGRHVRSANS